MKNIKPFTSNIPPGIVTTLTGTYITPGWITVPEKTTIEEVYAAWVKPEHKPGPGMYASTEDIQSWRNGTWKHSSEKQNSISEFVTSSNGSTKYNVIFNNGTWNCDCTGFGFRKRCKHVDEIKLKHKI
jgi:hypothetical protein